MACAVGKGVELVVSQDSHGKEAGRERGRGQRKTAGGNDIYP